MDDTSARNETREYSLRQFFFVLIGSVTVFLFLRHKSWFLQDALLWGTFLYTLYHFSRASRAWQNVAGLAAVFVVVFALLQIPFGIAPKISGRVLLKDVDLIAFAFAIPFLFSTKERIHTALLSAALAISAVICWDLARLLGMLGAEIVSKARWVAPFTLNHPNIMAMGAALAIIVLGYSVWAGRKNLPVLFLSLVALIMDIAYLVIVASRGPQLALIGAVSAAAFLAASRRMKLVVAAAVIVIAALLPTINPRFNHAFSRDTLLDRDKAWAHTWKLTAERPMAGYGCGDWVFMKVYHSSNPPRSPHHFYHPHQYWLNTLFTQGRIGVTLHAVMWLSILAGLIRQMRNNKSERQGLAGTVLAVILCLHLYGLMDTPTGIVSLAMIWIVPVALAVLFEKQT